ncbi:MAG: response regulator [Gammaproteobacteria bacterium]|jgi:PAS domain S-box-containing protein|nr:response regulator [Gammaproteobacteria bacterium]MBT4493477.1 response regulator [Gammaproteobacteria bacterium]
MLFPAPFDIRQGFLSPIAFAIIDSCSNTTYILSLRDREGAAGMLDKAQPGDFSETKLQGQHLLERHAKMLEMIATGQPSKNIYDAIALMYESLHPGMRCSLLELKGDRLIHGGAPSLPQEYCAAINGLKNGPDVGSCGTSTYTGQRVLVENIETDHKWANIKDVALPHGMRCCWSQPIKDSKGKVLGAFGMYYDYPALPDADELDDLISAARISGIVMERDQRELELRQSENNYRRLVENLPHRFFLKDKNSVIVSCSRNLADDLGKTQEELIGTTDAEHFSPKHANIFLDQDQRVLQSGIPEESNYSLGKENEKRSYRIVKAPALDEAGQVVGILGFYNDITEQQQLEENYHRAQKMESLGLLAGGVAHDLNNILSVVATYSELLLSKIAADDPMAFHLKKIRNSGFQASAFATDLLTIARGIAVNKEPLQINTHVEDYLASSEFEVLKQAYPETNIRSELSDDLRNINASSAHFGKVIMNLVSNAFESIGATGNVVISTSNRQLDTALHGYETIDPGEYVVFSVSDDGPGIPAESLKRIFEPFYTRKTMGRSGTGLGLTVVWNIVQDFKGSIDIINDKSGVRFDLYFPASRESVRDAPALPIDAYQGNGETILIVDDMEIQREVASAVLEELNYRTKEVSSGESAIEYLRDHPVDLVLLDMIMDPGMNGRETYEKISELYPGQKTVIVSGYAETSDVREAQDIGAGQFVKKPYTIEQIGLAVHAELNQN